MADAKIINYGQQISAGSTAIPDNTSEALDISSTDAKDYVTIDTTDSGEAIGLKQKVVITDKGGASGNIGQVMTSADSLVIDSADDSGMTILGDGNDPMKLHFVSDAIGDRSSIEAKAGGSSGNQYVSISTGGTERFKVNGSGQIETPSGLHTLGSFATTGGGTVGTGGSSDATLEQSGASTFQTALHVGAAIKIVDSGDGEVFLRTVASITDANTLEMDEAAVVENGSAWYHDSGELFAVKTGDSKTIFSVQPTGAIGAGANAGTLTGVYNNLGIGDPTMFDKLTTGNALFVMGNQAGDYDFTTANALIAIGYNACAASTTSQNLVAIGTYAADTDTDIRESVIIGGGAGRSSGNNSVHIGHAAGAASTGADNVSIGRDALFGSSSGSSNVAIGYHAHKLCTGSGNVVVGHGALTSHSDGESTIAASNCVALGIQALKQTENNGNIGIGFRAGDNIGAASGNICIGSDADIGSSTFTGCIAIGGDAITTKSNQTMIGNTSNLEITGLSTTAGTTLGSLTHPFGGLMLGARRIYSTRRSCGRVNSTNTGKIDQLSAFGGVSAVLLPAYSIITFCSVTIDDPSGASTHAAMLATSTATGTADDAALTGTVVEIIGSGASGTRSTATTGSATNIALNAVKGQTWYNDTKFHVGSAPVYVYLASAGTSNSGTPGDTQAYITVEYIGAT